MDQATRETLKALVKILDREGFDRRYDMTESKSIWASVDSIESALEVIKVDEDSA